jgi:hypothetical protein
MKATPIAEGARLLLALAAMGAVNVREHGETSMSSFFPLYRREFVE